MPLDQAVLEHQVVGGVPAEEGAAPQVDVVVVAARRDMVASFLEPLRRAGLRAGRRRPLRLRHDPRPRRRAGRRDAAAASPAQRPRERGPLLQPRRRHQPRRRARPLLPLHPRLPRRPGGDRRPPRRAPAASARSTPPSGSPTSASSGRSRSSRATPRPSPRRAARSRRASRPCSTSCASRSTTTAPRRRRCRSSGSSSAAPAARSPAWPRAMEARPRRCRSPSSRPPALAGFDDAAAARLTLPYGLALEQLSDAPRQPDPSRGAPRRQRAAAHRARSPTSSSARWSPSSSA